MNAVARREDEAIEFALLLRMASDDLQIASGFARIHNITAAHEHTQSALKNLEAARALMRGHAEPCLGNATIDIDP